MSHHALMRRVASQAREEGPSPSGPTASWSLIETETFDGSSGPANWSLSYSGNGWMNAAVRAEAGLLRVGVTGGNQQGGGRRWFGVSSEAVAVEATVMASQDNNKAGVATRLSETSGNFFGYVGAVSRNVTNGERVCTIELWQNSVRTSTLGSTVISDEGVSSVIVRLESVQDWHYLYVDGIFVLEAQDSTISAPPPVDQDQQGVYMYRESREDWELWIDDWKQFSGVVQ